MNAIVDATLLAPAGSPFHLGIDRPSCAVA
jgi:hypothetical protein